MTDNEIIKALECCSSQTTEITCGNCPLFNVGRVDCYRLLANNSLDLINRQQKDIDDLCKVLGRAYQENCFLEASRKSVRTEAIKEFAERLKKDLDDLAKIEWNNKSAPTYWSVAYEEFMDIIDRYFEEMVGEE